MPKARNAVTVKRSGSHSAPASMASFETLVRKVKETFLLGRERIEQELVFTYLETGKYIHEHILCNEKRAGYGEKVIPRLSERVEMSEKSLQEMVLVHREFPSISRSSAKLGWTMLRKLATIPEGKLRDEFIRRAQKGHWDTRQLQSKINLEIRHDSNSNSKANGSSKNSELLHPKFGTLYTYRLKQPDSLHDGDDRLWIDLGFQVHRKMPEEGKTRFKAGDIIESRWEKTDYRPEKSERTEADLFTYKAYIERVVDGDTLLVKIDLGFDTRVRQYLRLRGIDAFEISSAKGVRAREFAKRVLAGVEYVIITSSRSDKYDRYLADVFYGEGPAQKFLNNELLAKHLAVLA